MSEQENNRASGRHGGRLAWRVLVPVLIIIASVITASILLRTSPKPDRRPPRERVVEVDVLVLEAGSHAIGISSMGTVVPSREVALQSRVAGQVVRVSPKFIPGGHFDADEVILEIDPVDYELAVSNSWAHLVKAEHDFMMEQGMQHVAEYEWTAMQTMRGEGEFTDLDRELAMREPQLRLARGNLVAARAQLDLAELHLERTRVRAPFNAVVRSRAVNEGSLVSAQTILAELAGTDSCWVRIALPVSHSRWVETAGDQGAGGSRVTIRGAPGGDLGAVWVGRVLRKLPDLEKAGRMAQFLAEVPEPENPETGTGVLLLGAYVRVHIQGASEEGVFVIPRKALRDGVAVWIMNRENRLETRPVEVVWSNDEIALLRGGVADGERLVISDISVPLNGMLLAEAGARDSGTHRGGNSIKEPIGD